MNFRFIPNAKSLPLAVYQMVLPLEPILYLLPFYALFYFSVWQGIETAKWKRLIHEKVLEKEDLIRRNDDLKIGIVSYTSAERIEALYRRTYQYLPISLGNRIITVELPQEPQVRRKESF
jgi:hypothetical protein